MNLLFCHDGPIEKFNNHYYSIGFNDELFDRYKIITDNIFIAIRVHNNSNSNFDSRKYLELSSDYRIIECPNISSIKGQLLKRKCYTILNSAVQKADLVIIRLPSFIGNIAVEVCKKNKKNYYVELVGCPWDALWNHSIYGKLIAPFMYLKTKKNVKNAEYVKYVTNEFLQHRYPTKGKSIGCSDVKLLEMQNRKKYDSKINNNNTKIGTIGVLDIKYKGQKYVIKAIKKLKKEGINIKYELVGSGDNERLCNYAKKCNVLENVSFLGPMKHDDIFNWLKEIDIYIQPSTTEGMPRSLIEAMSVGCLCIASDVGGMPELLDSRFIFKKKSYKHLYSIIKSLKSEDYEKQSIKNYSYSHNFSDEKLQTKRNDFLKKYKKEIIDGSK